MRVYIFRNDEGLHAYTQDATGHRLPASDRGGGWEQCGFIADLHKLFPVSQAHAIQDVVLARGFYLFKP
jgi:hypothetical protein